MIVFHHNDADGRCAAAVVHKAFENKPDAIRHVEMDYAKRLDEELIGAGEKVVIVDFSFRPVDMEKILARTDDVTWIDHHKTSKEYHYSRPVKGVQIADGPDSGCSLAWKFFFPNLEPRPVVDFVADYDSWTHRFGKISEMVVLALDAHDTIPSGSFWHEALSDDLDVAERMLDRLAEKGRAIIRFRDKTCADYRSTYGFAMTWEGHECFVSGIYRWGSKAFGGLIDQYPVCMSYVFNGERWTIGIYSNTVDVSALAKKYGGGGHKGAAGFVVARPPWEALG